MPHVSDVLINDLHEGTLDPAVRDGVQRHLIACRACRARSDGQLDLRRRLAELPSSVEPRSPLWRGIRARIEAGRPAVAPADDPIVLVDGTPAVQPDESPAVAHVVQADESPTVETVVRLDQPPAAAPVVQLDQSPAVPRDELSEPGPVVSGARHRRPPRWFLMAAAALALVVASSAATLLLIDGDPGRAGNGIGAFAPLPASADPAARFAEAEAAYLAAAAELMTVVERERRNLPPDVAERADRALALIELAVRETRAALASDPHNRALAAMALTAHERRLEFLQRIARWSTES